MNRKNEFDRLVSDRSAALLDTVSGELAIRKDVVRKTAVEAAISMYQETEDDTDFVIVKSIYEPEKYVWKWKERYSHLFDSQDEFNSVFDECFVKACRGFADAEKRETLGINVMGNGSFNNYFYGVLTNTFANIMKKRICKSRNPQVRCPICDEMVSPLTTHVLRDHREYADGIVSDMVKDQGDTPWTCSLCPNYAKRIEFENREDLKQHVVAKHSSEIFDRFSSEHPKHSMAIRDHASSGGIIGDDEVITTHDAIERNFSRGVMQQHEETNAKYDEVNLGHAILSAGLSECQMAIVDCILGNRRATKMPSRKKLCENCTHGREGKCDRGRCLTKDEYASEITGLKEKMQEIIGDAGSFLGDAE